MASNSALEMASNSALEMASSMASFATCKATVSVSAMLCSEHKQTQIITCFVINWITLEVEPKSKQKHDSLIQIT